MPVPSLKIPLGSRIPWFSVKDLDGHEWTTALLPAGSPVLVAFLCNHSPYVVHIERSLAELAREAAERGVFVLGIASNDERAYPADRRDLLKEQATRAGWMFPYGFDESQRAAKAFGANCTPEFFLHDQSHRLVYHGQYDSSRPASSEQEAVTGEDVRSAIASVLAGEPVSRRQLPSFGCSVKWRAGNEPAYLSSDMSFGD